MAEHTLTVLSHLLQCQSTKRKLLAVLLDPEKTDVDGLHRRTAGADLIFVGGSTGTDTQRLVQALRKQCSQPVILFPGNPDQVCADAHALLFLTLLNARDAKWLIEQQVSAAEKVSRSQIESIPTGYLLIDGGSVTSVMRTTRTTPLSTEDKAGIVAHALAAELLGKQLLYLEAGSGAVRPIAIDIIRTVRERVSIPLIVGGGIRTPEQMQSAFHAGADIVVIGNHFEQHPEQISLFTHCL